MTLYGIETTHFFSPYRFDVTFDSGAEASLDQRSIEWSIKTHSGQWSQPKWVRSFYFDDCDRQYIRNFCKKFAQDQAYRDACIEDATDWSKRDSLFRRNIEDTLWQESPVVRTLGGLQQTYTFFKQHWKAITIDLNYKTIHALDSTFQPSSTFLDPEIQKSVQLFNTIPGIRTKFSCQGVSGTVKYANLDILVVTPHSRFGYIWFDTIPASIEQQLIQDLAVSSDAYYQPPMKLLISSGNNPLFRATAYQLAQQLIEK